MTLAQASVGVAATSPTSGTALMTPELIRQGAATTPQPASATAATSRSQNRASMAITLTDESSGNQTRPCRIGSNRTPLSHLCGNAGAPIKALLGKPGRFLAP